MRISDWSSDVCSSDLAVFPSPSFASSLQEQAGLSSPLKGRGLSAQQFLFELLGHFLDILRRPAGDVHAEAQAHRRQHFLDFVKRLAAEVRGAERSEEHTSELQSLMRISYAVFCLKTKKTKHTLKDTM